MAIVRTSAKGQELHLHGYGLEETCTAVTFEFTADKAGDFELESHGAEQVLLELTVTERRPRSPFRAK